MKMLTIVLKVDALPDEVQAVKETLGMYLEQFGDCRVVEVKAPVYWQASLFGHVGPEQRPQVRRGRGSALK